MKKATDRQHHNDNPTDKATGLKLSALQQIDDQLRSIETQIKTGFVDIPEQMKTQILKSIEIRRYHTLVKIEFMNPDNRHLSQKQKAVNVLKKLKKAGKHPRSVNTIKRDFRASWCYLYCEKGKNCPKNRGNFVQNCDRTDDKLNQQS